MCGPFRGKQETYLDPLLEMTVAYGPAISLGKDHVLSLRHGTDTRSTEVHYKAPASGSIHLFQNERRRSESDISFRERRW